MPRGGGTGRPQLTPPAQRRGLHSASSCHFLLGTHLLAQNFLLVPAQPVTQEEEVGARLWA